MRFLRLVVFPVVLLLIGSGPAADCEALPQEVVRRARAILTVYRVPTDVAELRDQSPQSTACSCSVTWQHALLASQTPFLGGSNLGCVPHSSLRQPSHPPLRQPPHTTWSLPDNGV